MNYNSVSFKKKSGLNAKDMKWAAIGCEPRATVSLTGLTENIDPKFLT